MIKQIVRPLFLFALAATLIGLLLASNSASAVLAAPTAATAPTNLGPFTAPNLPSTHDAGAGNVVIPFDLSDLAQFSSFSLHRVRLNFAFNTEGGSFAYEVRLTLTSPDGTVYTAPHQIDDTAGSSSNSVYNVELPDFYGESYAGTWTVTIWDDFDDGGDDFTINELNLTLLGAPVPVADNGSGLIGWWPMDGNDQGVLLQDHSGHKNDARPIGGIFRSSDNPLTFDDVNGSYEFDGTDHFAVPNEHGQFDSDDLVVAAWLLYEGDDSFDSGGVFSMRGASGIRFAVTRTSGGGLFITRDGTGGLDTRSVTDNILPAGEWIHLAVWFDQFGTNVYVNGEFHESFSGFTLNTDATGNEFSIGRNHNPKWVGKMADVRVYNDKFDNQTEIFRIGRTAWTTEAMSGLPADTYISRQTAVALDDGKFMLIGGQSYTTGDPTQVARGYTFEVTSPSSVENIVAKAGLNEPRYDAEAVRLNDGRILVAYGREAVTSWDDADHIELYDPVTDTWSVGPALSAHKGSATLLNDGTVLLAGGSIIGLSSTTDAFIFDPADDSLTPTGSLSDGRSHHSAVLLPDGKVFVYDQYSTFPEIYDPATGLWSNAAAPSESTHSSYSVLTTHNGVAKIAIFSRGACCSPTELQVQLYDIAANTWSLTTPTGELHFGDQPWHPLALPDGSVIMRGDSTRLIRYLPDHNRVELLAENAESQYGPMLHLEDGLIVNPQGNHGIASDWEISYLFETPAYETRVERIRPRNFRNGAGQFRTAALQPDSACMPDGTGCNVRPPSMDALEDFTEYADGQLYWQFCSDYGDPSLNAPDDGVDGLSDLGYCRDWENDLTATQRTARYAGYESSGWTEFTSTSNFRNEIMRVRDGYAAALQYYTSHQDDDGTVFAKDGLNWTITEAATIHMLFGNEFLMKANQLPTDWSQNPTLETSDSILARELDYLQRAAHQYMLATRTILDLADTRVVGVEGDYLINWLSTDSLRMLTYASEQQVTVLEEIIRREQLRAVVSDNDLIDEVAQAIATQNAQVLLIADLFGTLVPDDSGTSDDETAAAFVAAGGDTLINNIGRLSQLTEVIRADFNPLGYDAEFVPLKSTEDLLAFVCGASNACAAPTTGILKAAIDAETAFVASTRDYDLNQALLGDELDAIYADAATELTALCGAKNAHDNGDNWQECNSGLMEQNRLDFIATNQAAAIAWERASQIADLIAIEEATAEIVSSTIVQTGETLFANELAKGKLEAYRTTSTDFTSTSETDTKSVEASVTASVKASVNAGFPPGGGVEASVEVAATAAIGKNWESSTGNNVETTFDVNAEKIAQLDSISLFREAEAEATINNAESAAEVKRLLLEQSTLLLEYELSLVDINKVIAEHNQLVEQYQLLIDLRDASVDSAQNGYLNQPYFRLIKDRTAQQYNEKLRIAKHYAYLTAKSFEYVTLEPLDGSNGVNINDLYKVQTVDGLQAFMTDIASVHFGLDLGFNKHRYKVSFARHILGLTDEVIQNDTSATLTPAEIEAERTARFQQYVSDHTVNGEVIIDFATLADLPAATNYFNVNLANLRITGANNQSLGCVVNYSCYGLWLNFVTDQLGSDFDTNGRPDIRLSHGGHATYMRADRSFASYRPGPTRIIDAPSTFGSEDRTSDFKANINMNANVSAENPTFLTNDFQDLSVATSRWRLEIDLSASANTALDLAQLNDFEIRMDAVGFSANRSRDGQLEAAEAARLAAVQNGEPIPQDALATVENWLTEQKALTPTTNSRAVAATPAFTLTNETYTGRMFTLEPIALDSTSAGFELFFNSDNSITGTLCAYCSAGYENDVAVTGSWESASITPTFSIETDLFADVNGVLRTLSLNGEMQTRSRDMTVSSAPFVYAPFSGDPADGVQFLLGTFSETIMGISAESITRSGDFILTPPTADFIDSSAVPTAVGLASGQTAVQQAGVTFSLFVVALAGTAISIRRRNRLVR